MHQRYCYPEVSKMTLHLKNSKAVLQIPKKKENCHTNDQIISGSYTYCGE